MEIEFEEVKPFGEVDFQDIKDFEASNEVILPDDYKNFLEIQNGGRPKQNNLGTVETDVQWLYGMYDYENAPDWANFFEALDTYEGRLPSWYIPIGRDSGGNLFIMSLYEENRGLVAWWLHEQEAQENADEYFDNVRIVADNFTEFLKLLSD